MKELHVVFGASGPVGFALVRQLADAGVPVRAVVREDEIARSAFPAHAEVFFCDPIHRRRAIEAAEGATVVYRCITVSFSQWAELWLPITENIVKAAEEAGARLVSPGTVYVYGPPQRQPVTEDHPLAAVGPMGKVRIATQSMLCKAHRSGVVKVVIPRFPDLFGPRVLTRFHGGLFRRASTGEPVRWYGRLDIPRSLLFVEDAARACIELGRREEAYGRVWHVPGPAPLTPRALIDMVYETAGLRPRVRRVSTLGLRLEGIFDPDMRSFYEFRYRFEQPQIMDGTRFAIEFPEFQFTPYEEAVRITLDWFKEHSLS